MRPTTMPRSFAHITPRYVWDKLKVMFDQKSNPTNPWLTSSSVSLLKELLKPNDIGVEFGSGRSTIWFANKLKHLTSIEDNPAWFSKVENLLTLNHLNQKVDYRLFVNQTEYANQAKTFFDNSIDFCLIDGVARDKSAIGMLPKLKSGGVLVIDNINHFLPNDWSKSPNSRRSIDGPSTNSWEEFLFLTLDYRRIWTSNGLWDTCIFFKP